jgi:chemotaxis signal transduction protein
MNVHGSRLSAITKELWLQWQQTREYWQDAKSEEFERKYLEELVSSADKTVTVIEELDKLISKIKSDCE